MGSRGLFIIPTEEIPVHNPIGGLMALVVFIAPLVAAFAVPPQQEKQSIAAGGRGAKPPSNWWTPC